MVVQMSFFLNVYITLIAVGDNRIPFERDEYARRLVYKVTTNQLGLGQQVQTILHHARRRRRTKRRTT